MIKDLISGRTASSLLYAYFLFDLVDLIHGNCCCAPAPSLRAKPYRQTPSNHIHFYVVKIFNIIIISIYKNIIILELLVSHCNIVCYKLKVHPLERKYSMFGFGFMVRFECSVGQVVAGCLRASGVGFSHRKVPPKICEGSHQ